MSYNIRNHTTHAEMKGAQNFTNVSFLFGIIKAAPRVEGVKTAPFYMKGDKTYCNNYVSLKRLSAIFIFVSSIILST